MMYLNRTYNTTTSKFVVWKTAAPDTAGAAYPGPGVFGTNTSGFAAIPMVDSRRGTVRLISGSTTSTLAITDWYVGIDLTSGAHTMTLPALATTTGVDEFVVQKTSLGTNALTFALNAADSTAKIYFLGNAPSAGASMSPSDSGFTNTPAYTLVPDVANNCWRVL